jgi:hypothetical protein
MSDSIYQTTWCYIPEDSHLHFEKMGGTELAGMKIAFYT